MLSTKMLHSKSLASRFPDYARCEKKRCEKKEAKELFRESSETDKRFKSAFVLKQKRASLLSALPLAFPFPVCLAPRLERRKELRGRSTVELHLGP